MNPFHQFLLVFVLLSICGSQPAHSFESVVDGSEKSEPISFLQRIDQAAAAVELPIGRDQEEKTRSFSAKETLDKENHDQVLEALFTLYSAPPSEVAISSVLPISDAKAHYLAALMWLHAPRGKLAPMVKKRLDEIKFGSVQSVQGQKISEIEREMGLYYLVSEGTPQDVEWAQKYAREVDQINAKRGFLVGGFFSQIVKEDIDEVKFVRSQTSVTDSTAPNAWISWLICCLVMLIGGVSMVLGILAFVKSKRQSNRRGG